MMTTIDPRYVLLAVLGFLALLAVVAVGRGTRRQVHEATRVLYSGAAAVSLAGRSLVTAAVIVGVQWTAITFFPHSVVFWVMLGVPAMWAGYGMARAFTVATVAPRRGGGR